MRILTHWKIGTRLGLGFCIGVLAVVVLAALARHHLAGTAQEVQALVSDEMVKVHQLSQMKDQLNVVARGVRNIALMGEPADRQAEKKRIDDMRTSSAELLAALDKTVHSEAGRRLLQAASDSLKAYDAVMDKAIQLGLAGQAAAATTTLIKEVRPVQSAFFKALDALQLDQEERMRAKAGEIGAEAQADSLLMVAVAAVSAALALLCAWLITRSIVLPIRAAVQVARTVAAGDLTSRIEVTTGDETGELLQAMQAMNASLVAVVSQVRDSSEAIATGSGQVASGSADLSQRTEEQASSLQQTAASMEELTGTVAASADTARQANQLATSAIEAARSGGHTVSQVVTTMDEIASSSKKVSDIIGVIDGIAFQTNILALNAAVEAARAGEQGRGFAVVASEVRSLAQRSANAAKEIKTLIGGSVDRVEAGNEQVHAAGRAMAEIVDQVQEVGRLIGSISGAAVEQSSGIGQVGAAVAQLDQVTQQNAALVEESAAAAESLREQADRLVAAVRVFKLEGAAA